MTDELTDVVDDLTLPKNVKVNTDNGPRWATEDALLVQLEEAISSTTGRSGGRSLGHERMILDADALMRFHQITAAIGDWCRIEGVKPARNPVKDLRAWYARRQGRPLDQREGDEFYLGQMRGWAALIRGKLTPRRTKEWLAPCPECNATDFINEDGHPVPHPVVIEFNPDRIVDTIKWTCRSCETVQEGMMAQRYLARDAETRENEGMTPA